MLSCLVSNVHFNCIIQDSLYHNMDVGTMWHCALVSCTPSQSMDWFLGVRCSGVEYHDVLLLLLILEIILFLRDIHHDSCDYYWNFMGILFILNYTFMPCVIKLFWFCKCTTPWMFPLLDILLEYWIEHVTFELLSCLHCLPVYSTGEFQALQLIVLVASGAVD